MKKVNIIQIDSTIALIHWREYIKSARVGDRDCAAKNLRSFRKIKKAVIGLAA